MTGLKGTEPDLNQIQEQLRLANERIAKACWAEIQEICQKHRCNLVAIPRFTEDGRIVGMIRVIPVTDGQ